MKKLVIIGSSLLVLLIAVALLFRGNRGGVGAIERLPDGSTLQLQEVSLMTSNFSFSYRSGWKLARHLAPVLPPWLQQRLSPVSGRLGWSALPGETNLIFVTVHRAGSAKPWQSTLGRLQLLDDHDHPYDACWGASTLGVSDATVHGWRVQAVPRRSRTLTLRFLAHGRDGWTNVADIRVPNPLYSNPPQWQPEPIPNEKHDGALTVKLLEFESGAPLKRERRAGPLGARVNRLAFSFAENGVPSGNWRVQKLTVSDATGNHWSPYLDLVNQGFSWASNGLVEFFGALWPCEEAWRLRVEGVRTAGFAPVELWDVPLTLPAPRIVNTLSNLWEHDGATVKLVAVASPETDHAGDFRWTAKWWGAEKSEVYSLAVTFQSRTNRQRLSFVRCLDQDGNDVKLMSHQNQDSEKQAIFLRPRSTATDLRLTLAIQRSALVDFLARPQFDPP